MTYVTTITIIHEADTPSRAQTDAETITFIARQSLMVDSWDLLTKPVISNVTRYTTQVKKV